MTVKNNLKNISKEWENFLIQEFRLKMSKKSLWAMILIIESIKFWKEMMILSLNLMNLWIKDPYYTWCLFLWPITSKQNSVTNIHFLFKVHLNTLIKLSIQCGLVQKEMNAQFQHLIKKVNGCTWILLDVSENIAIFVYVNNVSMKWQIMNAKMKSKSQVQLDSYMLINRQPFLLNLMSTLMANNRLQNMTLQPYCQVPDGKLFVSPKSLT